VRTQNYDCELGTRRRCAPARVPIPTYPNIPGIRAIPPA